MLCLTLFLCLGILFLDCFDPGPSTAKPLITLVLSLAAIVWAVGQVAHFLAQL